MEGLYNLGEFVMERLLGLLMWIIGYLPQWLAAPFQYGFMQRALLTSIMVGAICGILSCYIILKRWSLLGDAISHAVLPGVTIAYIMNWPFFIGAFITGALTSLGIAFIERNTRLKEETAMGVMFTGAFALGIAIMSRIATSTHLLHILFGNVLGVRMPALLLTFVASIITLGIVLLFYKEFLLYSFDPVQASALGLNTVYLHYGLMLLLTLTIVASLETVGIILVTAMLITPGATAYLLTDKLSHMMILAGFFGVSSAVLGLYISYFNNIASGSCIVLVATGIFMLALFFSPQHGLIRWCRPKSMSC